jgi:hypothetical protein
MAKKRSPGAKDPATKNTLNPPNAAPGPERHGTPRQGKDTGQYTGEGRPSLQKK